MDYKSRILESIQSHLDEYMDIVKTLYDHPETGFQEYETQKVLVSYLKNSGFDVKSGVVIPTDYVAEYKSNKPGPVIAFMCEYDALPEVGHGCGHNLIAAIGIASGVALKSIIDEVGGTVRVVGTPGEENFGGKVKMSEAGVFDDVDAALMIHPATSNGVGSRTLAILPIKYEFFGKNAHGCHPEEGHSALDAAVMTYSSISMLRQFVRPGSYIHGIIRDGGGAANVIPAYTSMEYYFRAPTMKYCKEIEKRAQDCVEGACAATLTSYKSSMYECPYEDTKINYTLANMLTEKYKELGVENINSVVEVPLGSSDVGSVSYVCPTIQGTIKIAADNVAGHSKEMASATISEDGKNGLVKGSAAITMVALDLILHPETLEAAKREFEGKK